MTLLEQYKSEKQALESLKGQKEAYEKAIVRIEEQAKEILTKAVTPLDLLCAAMDDAGLEYYVYGGKWATCTKDSVSTVAVIDKTSVSVTYNIETNTLLIEGEEVKPLLAAA